MRTAASCAVNDTVVAAVLYPGALKTLLPLAHSASAASFPCIIAQPFEETPLSETDKRVVFLMPVISPPMLPRARWCNRTASSKGAGEYWSRRTQFLRVRLWHSLLEAGLNVLGIDASRRLRRNPLPALGSLRTRDDPQYGSSAAPDVVSTTPGWFLKQIGLSTGVWIRSTPATRALLSRTVARVPGCSDETIFTEELNWGVGSNATCCHHECIAKQFSTEPVVRSFIPTATPADCAANDTALPLAPPPPNASRNGWADPKARNGTGVKRYGTTKGGLPLYQRAWNADAWNTLAIPMHRFGRCTGRDASCVGLHPDCPPPPPPFTREVALAGKRKEAEHARLRGIRHRAERAAREVSKKSKHKP